jgi:hypothetical protein
LGTSIRREASAGLPASGLICIDSSIVVGAGLKS